MTEIILRTIGYQGTTPDRFRAALHAAGVTTLIDVRDAPVSRKPGFSRRALAAALEDAGIRYVHLAALGNPKAGRDAAHAGDLATYRRIYAARLAGADGRAALDEALRLAAGGGACLMCFERDPAQCHRTLVAEALAARGGMAVENLVP